MIWVVVICHTLIFLNRFKLDCMLISLIDSILRFVVASIFFETGMVQQVTGHVLTACRSFQEALNIRQQYLDQLNPGILSLLLSLGDLFSGLPAVRTPAFLQYIFDCMNLWLIFLLFISDGKRALKIKIKNTRIFTVMFKKKMSRISIWLLFFIYLLIIFPIISAKIKVNLKIRLMCHVLRLATK